MFATSCRASLVFITLCSYLKGAAGYDASCDARLADVSTEEVSQLLKVQAPDGLILESSSMLQGRASQSTSAVYEPSSSQESPGHQPTRHTEGNNITDVLESRRVAALPTRMFEPHKGTLSGKPSWLQLQRGHPYSLHTFFSNDGAMLILGAFCICLLFAMLWTSFYHQSQKVEVPWQSKRLFPAKGAPGRCSHDAGVGLPAVCTQFLNTTLDFPLSFPLDALEPGVMSQAEVTCNAGHTRLRLALGPMNLQSAVSHVWLLRTIDMRGACILAISSNLEVRDGSGALFGSLWHDRVGRFLLKEDFKGGMEPRLQIVCDPSRRHFVAETIGPALARPAGASAATGVSVAVASIAINKRGELEFLHAAPGVDCVLILSCVAALLVFGQVGAVSPQNERALAQDSDEDRYMGADQAPYQIPTHGPAHVAAVAAKQATKASKHPALVPPMLPFPSPSKSALQWPLAAPVFAPAPAPIAHSWSHESEAMPAQDPWQAVALGEWLPPPRPQLPMGETFDGPFDVVTLGEAVPLNQRADQLPAQDLWPNGEYVPPPSPPVGIQSPRSPVEIPVDVFPKRDPQLTASATSNRRQWAGSQQPPQQSMPMVTQTVRQAGPAQQVPVQVEVDVTSMAT